MAAFPRLWALAACVVSMSTPAPPAHADQYARHLRVGAWNLARKASPSGKRIEMMAVAAKETEDDFFLVMCAPGSANLYISIVTKEPTLTKEEPLTLKARFAFEATTSEFEMRKVLVDDRAVLRNDTKADIAALSVAMGKSHSMTLEAEGFKRSYDIDGFADAFAVVEGACQGSAEH